MTSTTSTSKSTQGAVFSDVVAMFVVCFLSLSLLVYVGVGEGQRTFSSFVSSKMAAQGEIIQNSMSGHLKAGLPLRQFVGFQTLSTKLFESDQALLMISVIDRTNKVVFTNQPGNVAASPKFDILHESMQAPKVSGNDRFMVRQSDDFLTVTLPLRSKFEAVGTLAVVMPRSVVKDAVGVALIPMLGLISLLSALFSWFVAVKSGDEAKRVRRQKVGLAVCFLVTSAVVVALLVALYSDGAQAKAKALASSLSERVGSVSDSRINLDDIDGLEKAFDDYRVYNRDIESIALLRNDSYLLHTDPKRVGQVWSQSSGTFEYRVALPTDLQGNKQSVTVALPVNVVYKAIGNSVKNFIVLFFASGFLAALVLQLANAIRSPVIATKTDVEIARSALEKCKPVLFLAVFVDNLSASFLPQLIRGYADTAQVHPFMASVAFMAYFICFAVVLVPAGKLAQRIGAKPLLVGGAVLIAVGLAILVATGDFGLVVLARVLQGLGQGILFIGVQTMILTVARKGGTQTKGNAITVYNFNAGMMAGMAIGSLLVLYMGSTGVFVFALVATVALAAYIAAVVPQMVAPEETATARKGGAILQALSSFEFLRALFGVGIPTKIVMTGVIMFGMPILLSTMAFESDEIGQIIMCYAIGVLLANHFISNVVSTRRGIDQILNRGMLLGAFGLLVIGGTGLLAEQWAKDHAIIMTMLMMVGVMAVGLGHGALNAPIVTYVANSAIAQKMGIVTTTSIYRVLERAGHVVGPMLVGQLLLFSDQKVSVIGWIGAALLVITVLFQLSHRAARNSTHWTT